MGLMLLILLSEKSSVNNLGNLGCICNQRVSKVFLVYVATAHCETFRSVLEAQIFDSAKKIQNGIGSFLFRFIKSKSFQIR
jgi:hypothetical protein